MSTREADRESTPLLTRWGEVPAGPSRFRVDERTLVFAVAAVAYLALSAYLILVHHAIFPDSLSRVGNAQYVVSSRDPHLASIGFVWNPLPSLLLVPFIPLRWLWPSAVSTGFLGGIESALFMAGAVAVLRGTLADLGLGRVLRLTLTAAFALHPMIVIYAYNGMSEAPLLFFALLTARALMSWLRQGTSRHLVTAGFGLALGYLTRYEMVAPALAVVLLVVVVSALRSAGGWRQRRAVALTDAAVVGLPFLFVFAMWALLARVIVKQWFPTLQSEYGNTAQVSESRLMIDDIVGHTVRERLDYVAHQLVGLEPLLAVAIVLALLLAAMRRDARALGPLAVAGAVISFDVLAGVTGRSFGWLRFEIAAIPLAVLLAGCLVATLRQHWLRAGAGLAAVAMVLPAVWLSLPTVFDRRLGREEAQVLQALAYPKRASLSELEERRRIDVAAQIARYVEAEGFPRGSVLTDAAFAFPVLLATRDPKAYVITPDQDFHPALADPVAFGVRYLLVPNPDRASFDALNVAYPTLYAQGWPEALLVKEWAATGPGPSWRLYRLPPPPEPLPGPPQQG